MVAQEKKDNFQDRKPRGSEKRQVPRIKEELTVRYRVKQLPAVGGFQVNVNVELPGDISRTRDLSENGVFFTASRAISPQAILDIKLQLPTQGGAINIEGRVVDCAEVKKDLIYKIRVEFINLKDEQKEALRNFVQLFLKG